MAGGGTVIGVARWGRSLASRFANPQSEFTTMETATQSLSVPLSHLIPRA